MIVAKVINRLLAFVGKELIEVVRRPGALLSLIAGPFLIMALFGWGYQGSVEPLRTIVVVPADAQLPTDVATYQEFADGMEIVDVVPERGPAEARLRDRDVDVVVIAPVEAEAQFRAGQRSKIQVEINVVDPTRQAYAGVLAARMATEVNQAIIQRIAGQGQRIAVQVGAEEAVQVPPEVIASPTESELINVSPTPPSVSAFYGPAVLALVLQHLALTLVALSLVRERTSGLIELFRVSPTSAIEVVLGKLVSFLVLGGAIAIATVALLVFGIGVPMRGDPVAVGSVIALLLVASLGLGLVVALVSDSERQVVQLSLLLLLASVFFSGFLLALGSFSPAVQAIAYALPVTHGIQLLQDLMLHGWVPEIWHLQALAAIAGVLFVVAWLGLRRSMTRI